MRKRLKDLEYREFLQDYFETNSISISDNVDLETITKQIDLAVEELPEKRKRSYKLSREKGYSYKEIADELDLSVKTVENQINLSLKHFKIRLGKDILQILLLISVFS